MMNPNLTSLIFIECCTVKSFLAIGEVRASSGVDTSGVASGVGVAHGGSGPLGAIGEIRAGSGGNTSGVLKGGDTGNARGASGHTQGGVDVVIAVGVVWAGGWADASGPHFLG